MELANQIVPQPSTLITSLKLPDEQKPPETKEEPKEEQKNPEGEQAEKKEEDDNTLVTFKDNSTYKGGWMVKNMVQEY